IDQMAEDIADSADPSIRLLGAARSELHASAAALTRTMLDDAHAAELRSELEPHEARMADDLEHYARRSFFPTERGRWEVVDQELRDVDALTHALLAKLDARDVRGAAALRAGSLA